MRRGEGGVLVYDPTMPRELLLELDAISRARCAVIDGVTDDARYRVSRLLRQHGTGERVGDVFDQCRATILEVEARAERAERYAEERHGG